MLLLAQEYYDLRHFNCDRTQVCEHAINYVGGQHGYTEIAITCINYTTIFTFNKS